MPHAQRRIEGAIYAGKHKFPLPDPAVSGHPPVSAPALPPDLGSVPATEIPAAGRNVPHNALTISSTIFLASPNSIIVLSL
ncbi:hypothetical protein EDC22_101177 [Tepidamorphus gemmatus]|uniref:Uncharacterized protein n=1 Tax=Tepidamorphus gemmatus TaxID=747076 RepID=A0A4R3MIW9_9HYPH|nr:hypothetical protein EDC22_101177 [Tepidamorphus gemmatus]